MKNDTLAFVVIVLISTILCAVIIYMESLHSEEPCESYRNTASKNVPYRCTGNYISK
jgi:hypothetical protein